ncbi:UBA domain-containing protein Mud1-like [Typha angustifolia]|uniref:UBA domain-containing protein Mud1-like n=1 Tax=Typha angustifolia TaxID=59011 RepID=UPI003C2D263B
MQRKPKSKIQRATLRSQQRALLWGALQLLNTLKAQVGKKQRSLPSKNRKPNKLIFVDIEINGKLTKALVDTGATHNFVADHEPRRLRLLLSKDSSLMKAMNSKCQLIVGQAKVVHIAVGSWRGKANFMMVPLDDFQVILGMEFLQTLEVEPLENGPMPLGITKVLKEFGDVMLPELLKTLPPCQAMDHKIELEPETKPPARAP